VSIPPEVLTELKKPLGKLILDSDITENKIKREIAGIKRKIITVGDRSTERLVSFNIFPNLAIIDGVERRQEKDTIMGDNMTGLKTKNFAKISCINPAGTITIDALDKIRHVLTGEKDVILRVIGEEDLLTLPACYFAPNDSLVCYGQPLEGLVLIKVNDSIKRKAKELMKSINSNLLGV
jgi:GTP-dependent dephospho-CoA kinase